MSGQSTSRNKDKIQNIFSIILLRREAQILGKGNIVIFAFFDCVKKRGYKFHSKPAASDLRILGKRNIVILVALLTCSQYPVRSNKVGKLGSLTS